MNQATTLVNPAFAAYQEMARTTIAEATIAEDPNKKHYIWIASETLPNREIAGGFIQRGLVTPVLAYPVWERTSDVPSEMVIRYRDGGAEALYAIPPHPIFDTIMKQYGDWGVVELTALTDLQPDIVQKLNIDGTFFPNGVPTTYEAMRTAIRQAVLNTSGLSNAPVYRSIAMDMERGIAISERFDNAWVDTMESAIELSKSDPHYAGLSTYDAHSFRALERLQRERRDHALLQSAATQRQVVDSLPELIKGMSENRAADFQAFAAAIADALRKAAEPVQAKPKKETTE